MINHIKSTNFNSSLNGENPVVIDPRSHLVAVRVNHTYQSDVRASKKRIIEDQSSQAIDLFKRAMGVKPVDTELLKQALELNLVDSVRAEILFNLALHSYQNGLQNPDRKKHLDDSIDLYFQVLNFRFNLNETVVITKVNATFNLVNLLIERNSADDKTEALRILDSALQLENLTSEGKAKIYYFRGKLLIGIKPKSQENLDNAIKCFLKSCDLYKSHSRLMLGNALFIVDSLSRGEISVKEDEARALQMIESTLNSEELAPKDRAKISCSLGEFFSQGPSQNLAEALKLFITSFNLSFSDESLNKITIRSVDALWEFLENCRGSTIDDLDEVVSILQYAITLDYILPESKGCIRFVLGKWFDRIKPVELNNQNKAIDYFSQALFLNEWDPFQKAGLLQYFARALYDKTPFLEDDFDQVIRSLEQALELLNSFPEDPESNGRKITILSDLGDVLSGVDFRRSTDQEHKNTLKKAILYLKQALKVDFSDEDLKRKISDNLDRIKAEKNLLISEESSSEDSDEEGESTQILSPTNSWQSKRVTKARLVSSKFKRPVRNVPVQSCSIQEAERLALRSNWVDHKEEDLGLFSLKELNRFGSKIAIPFLEKKGILSPLSQPSKLLLERLRGENDQPVQEKIEIIAQLKILREQDLSKYYDISVQLIQERILKMSQLKIFRFSELM